MFPIAIEYKDIYFKICTPDKKQLSYNKKVVSIILQILMKSPNEIAELEQYARVYPISMKMFEISNTQFILNVIRNIKKAKPQFDKLREVIKLFNFSTISNNLMESLAAITDPLITPLRDSFLESKSNKELQQMLRITKKLFTTAETRFNRSIDYDIYMLAIKKKYEALKLVYMLSAILERRGVTSDQVASTECLIS